MSKKLSAEEVTFYELQQFLLTCWKYGFLHDEIDQVIDSLMSELWPEAADKLLGDEEFSITSSFGELFHAIEVRERSNFVQDLENVIRHCVVSENPWPMDGIADEIRKLRNAS